MNAATCLMILRSSAGDESTLTPTLSHRNGRGSFAILRATDVVAFSHPRPLVGEGRVRAKHTRHRPVFTALAAAVLLSGCMVGPDYQRPPVATPDVFRASPTPTPDAKSIADLKWFEVFSDEQLQELIRTALAQNYDLRDAVARVDAARANLGITQADQYPNFGFGGGFTAVELSREGAFSVARGNRQRNFGT